MHNKNKIIRQTSIISTRNGINLNSVKGVVQQTKRQAKQLARRMGYPKNCSHYEVFDMDIPIESRPAQTPIINNVKEMLDKACAYGVAAKYSYVIDGEYDANGNKI